MPDKRKIAIVEDEANIRALLKAILEMGGYQVVLTGDPTEAVEMVRREAPDLVLCDIAMPVMDGYAVLRALQANPETARYPVVFLTAHREFTERVQAFKFGVVDYVTKPFTREILLRRLERVLKGLDQRSGAHQATVGTLVEDVTREARTGVLSVKDGDKETRVVFQAGRVVEQTAEPRPTAKAEFKELDADKEQIVQAPQEPQSLPDAGAAPPSFGELPAHLKSVLVVDDNAVFRKFLSDMLHAHGFTVHQANGAEEGLKLALELRPWMILADVSMPGMDGFEFCRRVRSHSLIRHTPFLFLSGWDDYKDRYKGMEAGADEYLSKTTPVRELLIRIHLILSRYSELGSRGRGAGVSGRIEVIGAPGFLQMCHLGRLTGVCTVRSGKHILEVGFRDGEIVKAEIGDRKGSEAIYEFLGWTRGLFEFEPGDPPAGEPLGDTFDQLVLEGCRRLDESGRL